MRLLPLWLLLLAVPFLSAQDNLVINYSFEEPAGDEALKPANPIEAARGWNSPSAGQPKLYTTVDEYIYDEYGSAWRFRARTGEHVAAMYVYGGSGDAERRGYIQGALKEPLTVGQQYDFSFWVHYHCAGANNIGIAFLPDAIEIAEAGVIALQPATHQEEVTLYDETQTWTKVEGSFVAYRPFKNFVIGNFFPNDATETQEPGYGHFFAYIDDITVARSAAPADTLLTEADAAREKEKWEYNEKAVAEDILTAKGGPAEPEWNLAPVFFDFDSFALRADAREQLAALAAQLVEYPDAKLLVLGHASAEGTDGYNQRLGARRAQAVLDFLVEQGVAADRLLTESRGENEPATGNDTEENRKKNRRATMEIVE